jgi:hypothetical protein
MLSGVNVKEGPQAQALDIKDNACQLHVGLQVSHSLCGIGANPVSHLAWALCNIRRNLMCTCSAPCFLHLQNAHALPGAAGTRGGGGSGRGGRRGAASLASPGTPSPSGGGITCVLFLPHCNALASAGQSQPLLWASCVASHRLEGCL